MTLIAWLIVEAVLLGAWAWHITHNPPTRYLHDRSSGLWFVYSKDGQLLVKGRHGAVLHAHAPVDHNPHGLRVLR